MFMPDDILGIEIVKAKQGHHRSAQACAVLTALVCVLDFNQADTEEAIDHWCEYIKAIDTDLCGDDLGSVFRLAARFFDKQADNLRDEQATTEVWR